VTVLDLRSTSATFTATLNPDGLSTSYYFRVSSAVLAIFETTATQTLATTSPTAVTFNDLRLEPDGKYRVQLVAENSDGIDQGPEGNPFATPKEPPLPIRIAVHPDRFSIGATISFAGTTSGSNWSDVWDTGYLQAKRAGSSKFVRYTDPFEQGAGTVSPNGRISFTAVALRNARWRAVLPGTNDGPASMFADGPLRRKSISKSVMVCVYPLLNFGASRPNNGRRISVIASAVVHQLPRGYVGEPVYMYISSAANGPWQRIGAPRLRPVGQGEFLGSENLQATISYPDPNTVYVNGCVRHQILRDMGKPFFDRDCGAASIRTFR
jgi:hypothetical protein